MYFTVKGLLWQASEIPGHGFAARCVTPGFEITFYSPRMSDILDGCSLHAWLRHMA